MRKKVLSVVGARPNFMKIAPIDRALAKYSDIIEHLIVHTGQHYDAKMSDAFFQDLDMPQPSYFLGVGSGSHAIQTAKVMVEFEKVLLEAKPDLVLVAGDVNSTLAAALTSIKLGIKTAHIESGLRSGDREMPEEINRIATDAICDYCFVTEKSGLNFLEKEGRDKSTIFFVGNTMIDSLFATLDKADKSNIINELGIVCNQYILATLHRPSNVDSQESLEMFAEIFEYASRFTKIVFPVHPRTLNNLDKMGLKEHFHSNAILIEPQGYVNFVALMKNSKLVITDSGGIQEETTALGVQCKTLRTTTERPSTIEIGTNELVMPNKKAIIDSLQNFFEGNSKKGRVPELWDGKAADRICNVVINQILNIGN